MLYLIKIIYKSFFLPPGFIIILLFLLAIWFLRKRPRISIPILLLSVLLYVFSIPLVSDNIINSLEKKYTPPQNIDGDVIVVLGGGATYDTPNVNGQGHLSGFASNRLLTGAQLYYKLNVPIIVSGGKVYEFTGAEAIISKRILKSLNIPKDMIIAEARSLNTTQNAKYTKKILDEYNFTNPILVTSAFHMHRSVKQFEKFGINVIPFPTNYQTNVNKTYSIEDFVPNADSLLNISLSVKEYIGIMACKWY